MDLEIPNFRIFSEICLLHKVMGHSFLVRFRGVLTKYYTKGVFEGYLRHLEILVQKFTFLVPKKDSGDPQFDEF